MFEIWSRSEKKSEKSEKVFCFLGNAISIGWRKLSLLRREYLSSAVNVLTNSSTISDITKILLIFQLQFSQSDRKIP